MGLTLMIIIFAIGTVAAIVMFYRTVGKNKHGANDPEAGSRPGLSQQDSSHRGKR